LMLLGIALIVFGLAFDVSILILIMRAILENGTVARWFQDALASIFPLAGLIVTLVGFFTRDPA
ncbi:MAG: hypothetical protein ACRDID_00140, partial [Ktedonobacterales bacterium]